MEYLHLLLIAFASILTLSAGQDTGACINRACYPRFRDLIMDIANRTIEASSTCGTPEDEFELRTVGANGDTYELMLCNSTIEELSHPVDSVTDYSSEILFGQEYTSPNLNTWWQSENEVSDVRLTLSLFNSLLFQGMTIAFRSPRPLSMIIEKSHDDGLTFEPIRYFADDCSLRFPTVPVASSHTYEGYAVVCMERYYFGDSETLIPDTDIQQVLYNPAQENGPNFALFDAQQYFIITDIQITLGVAGDTGHPLRSYFAIADWDVKGQCACYGHAEECRGFDGAECVCQHNTMGRNCEECLPLFRNRPWQVAMGSNANECQDCECNGRAVSCTYDPARQYGVCNDCTENTLGDKCEMCTPNFFRNPYLNPEVNTTCIEGESDPFGCVLYCHACNCSDVGTILNTICLEFDGQCQCKINVQGRQCDECLDGYWDFSVEHAFGCIACVCDDRGKIEEPDFCDKETGICYCKANVEGDRCDTCKIGSYSLSSLHEDGCLLCDCDVGGSTTYDCPDPLGQCTCRPHLIGRTCSEASPGYYVPKLDGIMVEGELPTTISTGEVVLEERAGHGVGGTVTGQGFLVVGQNTMLTYSNLEIPRTMNYQIVVRYESESVFGAVSVNFIQLTPEAYTCTGTAYDGSTLTAMQDLMEMGEGGVMLFGALCLRGGAAYNVTVNIGAGSMGAGSELLLDSIVALPVLEEVSAYTANTTSNSTKIGMEVCWNHVIGVNDTMRALLNCSDYEFSIMAEVFNGAKPCSCNSAGTVRNTRCDDHGGQCQCKDGIISLSCDYCAAHHYDYESGDGCTACNCDPNGSVRLACNSTGGCECHPEVINEKCDSCRPQYYGLFDGDGCVPCTCNLQYAYDNDCADSGQCSCKPGVGGQDCVECLPGFFNLTTNGCMACNCALDGSYNETCDNSGSCHCKANTVNAKCDTCRPTTYGFGPWSETGCIPCFCSERGTDCSTTEGWVKYTQVSYWSLLNSEAVESRWTGIDGDGDEIAIVDLPVLDVLDPRFILDLTDPTNLTDLFFVSPEEYQGDRRTAYGQILSLSLSQSTIENQTISMDGDVFIYGQYADEPLVNALPMNPGLESTTYEFKLHENYWLIGSATGPQASFAQLMKVLAGISDIRIRAKYTELPKESVFLHEVMLSYAVNETEGEPLNNVEDCQCPVGYAGIFCEVCAPGFTREVPGSGTFGLCIPCFCNGHSDVPCDPDTGVCNMCGDNTAGDACELCADGYYGDALQGTEDDCQPCMCPGPAGQNSFAATCDDNGICEGCATGHAGLRCEYCLEGYYGQPNNFLNRGGQCTPCFCSLSLHLCNSITGQCRNCTGNTAGMECDTCMFGYWGNIENCQACDCNTIGSIGNCTQDRGQCYCYPNVVGDQCTECAPLSFGYNDTEVGCTECDCHPEGTTTGPLTQCDLITGQCPCKSRVIDRQCDGCIEGYYNVDEECILCNCNTTGTDTSTCNSETGLCPCDVDTGQCTCKLPTIAGQACDRCGRVDSVNDIVAEVFVGSYPNCEPCPECFQDWRGYIEELGGVLTQQYNTLLELLSHYDNLTVSELSLIHILFHAYRIYIVTEELIAITEYLDVVMAYITNVTIISDPVRSYDGSVEVVPGEIRNIQQLQNRLQQLVDTQTNLFNSGASAWSNIESLYQNVSSSLDVVNELRQEVRGLLSETSVAITERQSTLDIINSPVIRAEYEHNEVQLATIESIRETYETGSISFDATTANLIAESTNDTANIALEQALLRLEEANFKVYESEVARFNASVAQQKSDITAATATAYEEAAALAKSDMTNHYIRTLDAYARIGVADGTNAEIAVISAEVQSQTLRPVSEMEQLATAINGIDISGDLVESLYADAANKKREADLTLNTTLEAQLASQQVYNKVLGIESDISEAGITRASTAQSVSDSDTAIANIQAVVEAVMAKGDETAAKGLETSQLISTISEDITDNEDCFRLKRAQAENAAERAGVANSQADSANTRYGENVVQEMSLNTQVEAHQSTASTNANRVENVYNSAVALREDVTNTQNMEDLSAMLLQYMQQRAAMDNLQREMLTMDTDLDAILANLEGAGVDGEVQCAN
ncbi:laminin subunit gamma-1-like [Anneissia japonica]|uniref:laminin subunit gamma-1-like n=1 Tax=Anneissia japonica TaxID=1529436 RepID=UPI0014256CFC|nr:laminin subunit gamma-1-like [Anneissia japonica]